MVEPGDLMIMYGSTTFFILVVENPLPHRGLWSLAGAFEGESVLAGGMATSGSVTRWFRDELARDASFDNLFAAAGEEPAGAGGLLMLPYFSGERTPINNPQARGAIIGLSLTSTREQLFRSLLESVGNGVRHNLEAFRELGHPIDRVVAVGGGARSSVWPAIVSNVAGVAQELPENTIGASYGDAQLAGLASGLITVDDAQAWVRAKTRVAPQLEDSALYDANYLRFRRLYEATKDLL